MAASMNLFPGGEMRIALIGKTGAGKSSTANTILGKDDCKVACSMSSETMECTIKYRTWNGLKVSVVDTPGVCDTDREFEEVHREICKSVALASPGPHAIVMCMRADERFTQEELEAYLELKELFGHGTIKHMFFSFGGIDRIEEDPLSYILEQGRKVKRLGRVLADLNGRTDRIVFFNNMAGRAERNTQAATFMQLVQNMVQANDGKYFTNDITKMFERRMRAKAVAEKKTTEQVKEDVVQDKPVVEELKRDLPAEKINSKRWCTIL